MSARWMSHLVYALVPLAAIACGDDDPTGTGGAGGSGGATTTTTTTSGPTTVTTGGNGPGGGGPGGGGQGGDGGFGQGGDGGAGGAGGQGGDTGEGGGFGGGVEGFGVDACPGDDPAIELVLDAEPIVYAATTLDAVDDLDTCFSETPTDDGGDWVFQFTLPTAASLRITLQDLEGLDGNLVVRPDCASADEFCFPHDVGSDFKEYALHTEPDTFSVIIDSMGTQEGAFNLFVSATTPECGDGILNPGEDCDPGAGNPVDTCTDPGQPDECLFEPIEPVLDQCPGEAIAVAEGTTVLLGEDGYTTAGFADDYVGTCNASNQTGGVDRVFAFTPAVTGMLTVRYGGDADGNWICDTAGFDDPRCWDGYLYARSTCDLAEPELDCSNDIINEIMVDVVQGVPVYVFVDGYNGGPSTSGPFDLELELIGL